ncbi:MAG: hypothetical protein GX624_07955 [Actinobacteria bacterium]|nr:hypothetical protein [Actinomycetota bacterium]
MTLLFAAIPGHVLDDAKRSLFLLLVGFIVTFLIVRLNTRLTRRHGRSHLRISSVVTPGGLHIHHSVFGIVAMVVAGILEFALQPGSPWVEVIAFAFGCGAALTLDEFALILHLEDVYWTGEGRKSIDAVILGITFMTLLLTGLLPATFSSLGDYITLSRWVFFCLVLSGALFVVVCYLKGKLFVGTVGIFVPPVAFVGALRLGKPGSPWARWRYKDSPGKLERALRRDQGFHQKWERRKHMLWDVIGGKPHLSLPHLDGHRDRRDHEGPGGPADGSRTSRAQAGRRGR